MHSGELVSNPDPETIRRRMLFFLQNMPQLITAFQGEQGKASKMDVFTQAAMRSLPTLLRTLGVEKELNSMQPQALVHLMSFMHEALRQVGDPALSDEEFLRLVDEAGKKHATTTPPQLTAHSG